MNERLRVALCGIWVNETNSIELAVSDKFRKIVLARFKDFKALNCGRSEIFEGNIIHAFFPILNSYVMLQLEIGKITIAEIDENYQVVGEKQELKRIAYL